MLIISFSLTGLRLTGDSLKVSSVLFDLRVSDNLSACEKGLKIVFRFLSSSVVTTISFPCLVPDVSSTLLLLVLERFSLLLEHTNSGLSKEIFRTLLCFTLDLDSFSSSGVEIQLRTEISSSVD